MEVLILIILGLVFAIPSYGISIVIAILLIVIMSKVQNARDEFFESLILSSLFNGQEIIVDGVYFMEIERYVKKYNGSCVLNTLCNFDINIKGQTLEVMFKYYPNNQLGVSAKPKSTFSDL